MVADSAFGRNGQPWFVPDFGQAWHWKVMLAFRVSRLGKCISAKFAGRYVDAVAPLFVPDCDAPEASVLLGCMDGGAVAGSWKELPLGEVINVNGHNVALDWTEVCDFVALTSRHVTLKTGDILAVDIPGSEPVTARINDRVEVCINGEKLLGFNIK